MESTATISFSAIHGRLLSNVHPLTMSSAALRISAVSSTRAGGFPAPAPIPRLPEERTAVTTPGPPVAAINGMSLCFIIISLDASVGFSTVHAILSGPPASKEASFSRLIAKMDVLIAAGCGLNTTVFPPASMPIVLQRTVSLGFVHGVIAPITPNGPISISVNPRSPDHAVVVISSVPGVFSATSTCLRILCPTFPMPVSCTPIRAMISAFSLIFVRILDMIFSLWSMDIFPTIFCVFFAAAMASFISLNTPWLPDTSEVICIFAITS